MVLGNVDQLGGPWARVMSFIRSLLQPLFFCCRYTLGCMDYALFLIGRDLGILVLDAFLDEPREKPRSNSDEALHRLGKDARFCVVHVVNVSWVTNAAFYTLAGDASPRRPAEYAGLGGP